MMNNSNASTKLNNNKVFKARNKTSNEVHTATEMAISDSVTVSIGEETNGALSVIFLVRADVKSYQQEKNHA